MNTLLRSRTACLALAAVSVGTAAWVRAVAVRDLPADFDEFEYIPAAFRYVERLAPGRWSEIPSVAENPEHPPFVKILYGAELRRTGAAEPDWKSEALDIGKPIPPEARAAFAGPRSLSAVAGVLQVLLVALVSPLGSLWLAFDTYHAKFTAEALLEGVPGLFALLSVLLAERGLRLAAPVAENRGGRAVPPGGALLLLLSAVMLGLAAAGKYVFGAVVGLALLPFLLARLRRRPRWIAAYAALTLVTFVLADPALWIDPLGRLSESVFFHWRFATGAYVKKAGLPWFQPFVWLTHAAPARWHPGVFPVSWLDPILLVVATLGIPAAWRKRPLWVAWAVVGLVFLLLWPTKWPQYTMVIRPPLAVLAGMGLASAATWIAGRVGLSRRAET